MSPRKRQSRRWRSSLRPSHRKRSRQRLRLQRPTRPRILRRARRGRRKRKRRTSPPQRRHRKAYQRLVSNGLGEIRGCLLEQLGDLDGIERRAFKELIAGYPEGEAV